MAIPWHDAGIASGLLSGFLFGYVLENAGFGSPCKLTAQFHFSDWSVLKVMLTAIVVAALGMYVLELAGLMEPGSVYVTPPILGAAAIGGLFIGAGFAMGGYCPGTSVVGMFTGRLDALFFVAGVVLGTWVFAGAYDQLADLTYLGEIETETLPELTGLPEWALLAGLLFVLVAVFVIGTRVERSLQGPVRAEQVTPTTPTYKTSH